MQLDVFAIAAGVRRCVKAGHAIHAQSPETRPDAERGLAALKAEPADLRPLMRLSVSHMAERPGVEMDEFSSRRNLVGDLRQDPVGTDLIPVGMPEAVGQAVVTPAAAQVRVDDDDGVADAEFGQNVFAIAVPIVG